MNAHEISGVISALWLTQPQPEAGAQPSVGAPATAPVQAPGPRVPGAVGAQSGTGQPLVAPQSNGQPGPGAAPGGMNPIFLIAFALLAMVIVTSMTGRKEKKRRAELLSSIKKYDRVQTLGGIIGTILELGESEVVLRVDEATDTRIRFARSAIQGVVKEAKADAKQAVEAKPKNEKAAV